MTIDYSKLTQLKDTAQNSDMRVLIDILIGILTEIDSMTTSLSGEIVSGVTVANSGETNTIKVTLTKENEETVESGVLTITIPTS